MNKNKSKAAYTIKWLNRNKKFWYEETKNDFLCKNIIITKTDAPKIVLARVNEINRKRHGIYYYNNFSKKYESNTKYYSIQEIISILKDIRDIKKLIRKNK